MPKEKNIILSLMEDTYGGSQTDLNYENPLQLLIATILSAQCTDIRVNEITAVLFQKYHTATDFATANIHSIESIIKSCGLYRNKARFIINACQLIDEVYGGEVPQTRKDLESLPGVGRKTANVVLANAFAQDAIAVDTHVFRVANRLGLAQSSKVDEVEQQLMVVIPKHKWSEAHHWLIQHGRHVCKARNPQCRACFLTAVCQFYITDILPKL